MSAETDLSTTVSESQPEQGNKTTYEVKTSGMPTPSRHESKLGRPKRDKNDDPMDFDMSQATGGFDNPDVSARLLNRNLPKREEDQDEEEMEELDDDLQDYKDMIWDLISSIKDPEYEYTLEELQIVKERDISISRTNDGLYFVRVLYTPTVPHCSQALTIGLCLARSVGTSIPGIKYQIKVRDGKHNNAKEITKQINDKERVAAALEHPQLNQLVTTLLKGVRGR